MRLAHLIIAGTALLLFAPCMDAPAQDAPPVAREEAADAQPAPAPEAAPEASGGTEAAPAEEKAPATQYRANPLAVGGVRAPSTGRPDANPLANFDKRSLRDALTRPIEFGEPGLGFSPPDWTEPLRDIEADVMNTDLTTGETVLRDNVRLRLGEMYFRSDNFSYSDEAGNYRASGNVLVEQHESRLTANTLNYVTPEKKAVEETFILEPANEENVAKRRLSMGRLMGEYIHVKEPTREMWADKIDYDFATQKGELVNARGRAALFHYRAGKLHILGPDEMIAEDVWMTTCPDDDPHYRILMDDLQIRNGEVVSGSGARLQIGRMKTPVMVPFLWGGSKPVPWRLDFDSGRHAETGSYLNIGQQFQVSRELSLGPRIMPTDKQGVGFGADAYYDYMKNPASPLYRTKGEMHGLQTTRGRGYYEWYHRYEYDNDLVLRMQAEQWSDETFYKDFFYDQYRHRGAPRTFANVTLRREDFIATGTARVHSHGWTPETERLPEGTFHLLERPLADRLHASFDTIDGYNDRNQTDDHGMRSVNIARLTYEADLSPALSLTPFYEIEGAWYEHERLDGDSASRVSHLAGATLQTRFNKTYGGWLGFSGFKHVVVPSLTYSYRPSTSLEMDDTPFFDALDSVYGRSRVESKISNLLYGRDAESGEVWQVGRLSLYQGNDLWNEERQTDDYEVELDVRPRSWWGFQIVGEKHVAENPDSLLDEEKPFRRLFQNAYESVTGSPLREGVYDSNYEYADYQRLLSQVYYDGTARGGRFSARVGYSHTETEGDVYNKDVLYGLGYKLDENWSVGFEHIFDVKEGDLRSQTYEIRRRLHCMEAALQFRDRESGFDVNFDLGLAAFSKPPINF